MKIAIAADHGGYELKETLKAYIEDLGHDVVDFGTNSKESVDYPDFAKKLSESVAKGNENLGVLICGTGIGMSISANKVRGIRAACVSESFGARMARQHNNANVICLGARVIGDEVAKMIVDEFLSNEFLGERHSRRVDKIMEIEKESYNG
ncbi:MAG: ribose 5-phosphate isomerase B [Finegoldia sp.]|nr:ribose 5-phosphate isomerase B [Finegoldia sp.]